MIHNSSTTGSSKWGGNWGTATGKYGAFTCLTCHQRNISNIKQVKTTLSAPTGPDQFPIEAAAGTVSFTDARDGSADFGHDADAHPTSSKICESCHTYDASGNNGVKFHAYNMSTGGADLGHYNGTDCTKCHKHNQGFKASCTSCHGNPPTSITLGGPNGLANDPTTTGSSTFGAHAVHVTTLAYGCNTCHTGWETAGEMPKNGDINIGFSTFGSVTGSYSGQDGVSYNGTPASGPSPAMECSNVYCHGSTLAGGDVTPIWNAPATGECGDCHGATNAAPGTLGSHQTHVLSSNLNLPCADCHGTGYVAGTSTPDSHVNGKVLYNLAALSGSAPQYNSASSGETGGRAPSASYKNCSGLYCHSDGAGGAPNQAPTWGTASTGACGDCHNTGTAMASGKHAKHVNPGTAISSAIGCDACHVSTSSDGSTITGPSLHVLNEQVDVTIKGTWDGDATPANDYGDNNCSDVYCHSDGRASWTAKSVTWSDTSSGCNFCHNAGTGINTGSHGAHVNDSDTEVGRNIGCAECHADTVSDNTTIATAANHIDTNRQLKIANQSGTVTSCSGNVSCHSNGNYDGTVVYNSVTWGGAALAGCDDCHGDGAGKDYPSYADGGVGTGASNSHNLHVGTEGYGCVECHKATTNSGSAIDGTTPGNHVNFSVEVSGDKIVGGYAGETCSNITCHGGGSAAWGDSLSCSDCHTGANDVDNYAVDSTPAIIKTAEWTSFGHGLSSASTYTDNVGTPNNGANFVALAGGGQDPCLWCHDSGAEHNITGATNPFRLKHMNEAGLTNTPNDACLWCHDSNQSTADYKAESGFATGINLATVVKVDKWHAGDNHGSLTNNTGGTFCWDCHDPHGDGANIKMVQSYPTKANNNANAFGVPTHADDIDEAVAVVFTDNSLAAAPGGFARDSADGNFREGICNACHTYKAADPNKMNHYYATGSDDHKNASRCTSCHDHSKDTTNEGVAFAGGGCSSCHGGGSVYGAIANYWPDSADQTVDNSGANKQNDSGLHVKHLTILAARVYDESLATSGDNTILKDNTGNNPGISSDAKQKALCLYCHQDADTNPNHSSNGDDAYMAFKHLSGAADGDGALDAYTPAASVTCSSTDCHNSKTTSTWYAADSSVACTLCHTAGGSNTALLANPNSGLHTGSAPTISGKKHDDSLSGGCTACHTALPSAGTNGSSHINGTVSDDGSVAGDRTAMGLFGTYQTSGSDNVGTCATSCHNGAGDNGSWARLWDATVHYNALSAGEYTECAGCHGGFASDWTFGNDTNTSDGNVSHDYDWDTAQSSADGPEVIGSHPDATDKCKSCHGFGYAGIYDVSTFAAHRDGKITFNDEMGYNSVSYDCTTYCHQDNTDHNLEDSGWSTTGNTVNCPPLACTDCHAGAQASAGVNADSPHSTNTIFASKGVTYSCADCHGGHGLGDTQVPNYNAVGINYGTGGIDLSDPVGSATIEAQICWNCHDANGVSEWGLNTDTNTGSFPNYNSGSLNQQGWNGAIWSSADFIYKSGTIQSTHSVNSSGASGVDADSAIRCSYCHDVHDTNNATGDAMSGKPYLRGSWVGNPYPEDGAPRNDGNSDDADYSVYDVTGRFGAVPRGDTGYTVKGGYYIDQNSGSPTANAAMDSPDEFAGLCRLCHEGTSGTPGDGFWQADEIDNLNKFGTPSDAWVGTNGHSAVVKGSGGSHAANIFTDAARLGTSGVVTFSGHGSDAGNPTMAYRNTSGKYGYGFRGFHSNAFQIAPGVDGGTNDKGYNYNNYDWGTDGTSGSADVAYHQFTCSKCHNPHASRLPRLMITNCLDTNHNTWDDTIVLPAAGTNNGGSTDTVSAENGGVDMSNATSAQNCHRVKDPNFGNAFGDGWNTVTPWQEF